MTKNAINIMWFRQDLRLSDNPALDAAVKQNISILPIYILDDNNAKNHKIGAASRFWLHHSLLSLNKSLDNHLSLYQGDPLSILSHISTYYDIQQIFWNRCYEPWRITRDTALKKALEDKNIIVNSYNASLLWEPWHIKKDDGTPYKVFTPFYRKGCLNAHAPRQPIAAPVNALKTMVIKDNNHSMAIDDLCLLPKNRWDITVKLHWDIGEKGAQKRLSKFMQQGIKDYKEGRNIPAKDNVSRLSPHLHFGEISPHQLWHTAKIAGDDKNIDHFCSELGWREFSYSQLYFNPDLPTKNLQPKFDYFSWVTNKDYLKAWQKGQTGIPIVDAGMRELWQTGYMHNRVRMIVGSFLVKNLLIHWHHGEQWFWDCLVDADLANNSASWQWVAGCGADAAPYFRIFNPITQGQKFDTEGQYTKKFVPELKNMPIKYLFNPWEAPNDILKDSAIILGKHYPYPIIDLKISREKALNAFQALKQ